MGALARAVSTLCLGVVAVGATHGVHQQEEFVVSVSTHRAEWWHSILLACSCARTSPAGPGPQHW